MKSQNKFLPYALLMIFSFIPLNSFAQAEIDDIQREITEGKIRAAELDNIRTLLKQMEQKQQIASNLINEVNSRVIDRYSVNDESVKEENEYALIGFISRLQAIHREKEIMEMKDIGYDLKTIQEINDRLDKLILDLKSFLK